MRFWVKILSKSAETLGRKGEYILPKKAGPPPGAGRETTSQVLTCGGPNGTTYRRQRTPAGQAAPPGPTQGKHCSQGLTSPEFVVSFKS